MRDGGERAMKITRGHDRRSAHRDAGSTMRHRLMKGHAGAPDRSRGLLIWVIFAVSALLPGLAHASPPDPSWISGVYDDADGDDVILLLTSGTGGLAAIPPTELRPPSVLAAGLSGSAQSASLAPSASALHSRAPPSP